MVHAAKVGREQHAKLPLADALGVSRVRLNEMLVQPWDANLKQQALDAHILLPVLAAHEQRVARVGRWTHVGMVNEEGHDGGLDLAAGCDGCRCALSCRSGTLPLLQL